MNFSSQIFFSIPFCMAVASYCYYEKVPRTMQTAIVPYLLKYFHSFSAAELKNIDSEDEYFAQEFSYKGSDDGDSDDEDIDQLYIWQVK